MGLLGSLFGDSSKTSQSIATTITKTQDQRIGIEGGFAGQMVAPGGTLASPGSVATTVGDYSTLTQTISGNKFKVGMSGQEVADLVRLSSAAVASVATDSNAKLQSLATTALSSQSGIPADWQKYIVPVGALLVVLAYVKKGR